MARRRTRGGSTSTNSSTGGRSSRSSSTRSSRSKSTSTRTTSFARAGPSRPSRRRAGNPRGVTTICSLPTNGRRIGVAAGDRRRVYAITDFHKEKQVPTIRIRTRRGYSLEGALKHRVLLEDGRWLYLKDIKMGDRGVLDLGANVWPSEQPLVGF